MRCWGKRERPEARGSHTHIHPHDESLVSVISGRDERGRGGARDDPSREETEDSVRKSSTHSSPDQPLLTLAEEASIRMRRRLQERRTHYPPPDHQTTHGMASSAAFHACLTTGLQSFLSLFVLITGATTRDMSARMLSLRLTTCNSTLLMCSRVASRDPRTLSRDPRDWYPVGRLSFGTRVPCEAQEAGAKAASRCASDSSARLNLHL